MTLFGKGFLARSTDAMEAELKEMENAFCLILVASLSGIPAPPSYLGVKLLPHLEREMQVMLSRAGFLDDQLANWFGLLDFG